MEKIKPTPKRVETTETKNGGIYPGGLSIPHPKFVLYTKQDHPFLQKFIEAGLKVFLSYERWMISGDGLSLIIIRIYEDHVFLECIATKEKERQRGKGHKLMEHLTDIADETGTLLKTYVSEITKQSNGSVHPVVALGAKGEKKIPAKELPEWFEKFGFIKEETIPKLLEYTEPFDPRCVSDEWDMERQPIKK